MWVKALVFLVFLGFSNLYAEARFLLCGSDEDGCSDYRSCACIPFEEVESTYSYCLDLEEMACVPLVQTTGCYPLFIYKSKGACLAVLFQSEPVPPCVPVSGTFCEVHQIAFCDSYGHFYSCRRTYNQRE